MEWVKSMCRCRGRRSEGRVSRCQYGHLRGWALLIDAPVRQRAAGVWRRPSISSLHKSLCLLLSIQLSLSLWPSILFDLHSLTCPSFSHTSTSSPSIIHTSAQLRSCKSLKYGLRIIRSSSPAPWNIYLPLPLDFPFLPRGKRNHLLIKPMDPLELMEKTMGCFTSSSSFTFVHPNPFLPSTMTGFCLLSSQSGCYVWGSGTHMGNILLNDMLLHMYKHPQWEHGVSTRKIKHPFYFYGVHPCTVLQYIATYLQTLKGTHALNVHTYVHAY